MTITEFKARVAAAKAATETKSTEALLAQITDLQLALTEIYEVMLNG